SGHPPKMPLDFEYLGILMTATDFARIRDLRPTFERRLLEWNLDRGDPIATTIVAQSEDQIADFIRDHPEGDFFPAGPWASRDQAVHEVWDEDFLLSREVIQRP